MVPERFRGGCSFGDARYRCPAMRILSRVVSDLCCNAAQGRMSQPASASIAIFYRLNLRAG
jgi:hypothetical protein